MSHQVVRDAALAAKATPEQVGVQAVARRLRMRGLGWVEEAEGDGVAWCILVLIFVLV